MRQGKHKQTSKQSVVITTLAGEQVAWEPGHGLPQIESREAGYVVVLKQKDGSAAPVELTPVLPGSAAYGVQAGLITAITKSGASANIGDYIAKRVR